MKNNVFFSGAITSQSIFALTTNLFALQYGEYPEINLHIQSPGGSLLPTLGVVDLIKTIPFSLDLYHTILLELKDKYIHKKLIVQTEILFQDIKSPMII